MKKDEWYTFRKRLGAKNPDGSYDTEAGKIIGFIVDDKNMVTYYEPGEEKKYKAAVTRAKRKETV